MESSSDLEVQFTRHGEAVERNAWKSAGRVQYRTGLPAFTALFLSALLLFPDAARASDDQPLSIVRQGSFEAGGKVIGDPSSASLSCDHGHVEFQIPAHAHRTALFLWHSSSAAVWQRRWDGGEGYQSKLLREGWSTFLWDGPRVGRANWGCTDYTYHAREGRDQANFTSWRLGPRPGEFYPGEQFPVNDPAALEQANRARYDEFDTVANARLESDAAAAAMDTIGPAVLLTNSAGGFRALLTALKSDQVKGIVAYENPGYVLPADPTSARTEGPFGPVYVSEEEFARFTKISMQFVWGDHVEEAPQWARAFAQCEAFAKAVNERGGDVQILRLPDAGLHGNSHIPFADLNNDAVARLLFQWLEREGFE